MKNILYIGHFKDASGYANAARGYLSILDKFLDHSKYNLKIFALNFEKEDYSNHIDKQIQNKYILDDKQLIEFINNNEYTVFLHALPNFCNIDIAQIPIKQCLQNKNCKKKINFVAWETDTVPEPWKQVYNSKIYDELVVFCNWNKEVFEKDTGLKATVVYHPIYDYYEGSKTSKLDKFTIFSMSQWQHRKGFDILVRAYYQEFFDHDDVELFIKTYRSETTKGFDEQTEKNIVINEITKYKQECLHYGKLPKCKISLKMGFCDKSEIKKFYENAHVFCSPTRGEGFGMTIAQAAMSGLPCIVPNLGGHLDYLDPDNNYFIDSRYDYVYNMPFNVYSAKDMKYIEPSLSSTREQLRKAYDDWKKGILYEKSNTSKIHTKSILSEEKLYKSIIKILEDL